jgi:uncharacterized protein YjbI with pentapeptide repeats
MPKMNKSEALQHFQKNYVKPIGQKQLLAVETYFQDHLEELAAGFRDSFQAICRHAQAMQTRNSKGPIGYLHYSWLRTKLLGQDYRVLSEAYDGNWYLDRRECLLEYDTAWLWRFWAEFAAELEQKRRPYLDQITAADLELITRREVSKYGQYLVSLARYALNRVELGPEYQAIAKEPECEVRVGEYRDLSEIVRKTDTRSKDLQAIRRWLAEKAGLDYCYEVFSNLDLSQGDYEGLDLRYCDLRECDLSDSNLQNTTLLGTNLADSRLDRAQLQGALLYEADLHNCSLRNADFSESEGPAGPLPGPEWQAPGFRGVNFAAADLTDTVFRDVLLPGADFRGAILERTDFCGADLQGALFTAADRQQIRLTKKQSAQVRWE